MNIGFLQKGIQRIFRYTGYDIRRIQKNSEAGKVSDIFLDQKYLLSDNQVRVVFDIGASVGEVTGKYLDMFQNAVIHSFEPHPQVFKVLKEKYEDNSRFRPVQSAVAEKEGKTPFHINRESTTSSLLHIAGTAKNWVNSTKGIENIETVEVSVTTIDNYCDSVGIDEIDVLKMDIQGGELMALKGAVKRLNQQSIKIILLETFLVPVYEHQSFFTEIYDFLSEYGYILYGLYEPRTADRGRLKWCDAIFINNDIYRRSTRK